MKRTVLVTGSSRGMGKAEAIEFAKRGWTVTATMQSPEKETELTSFENVHLYSMDIADCSQVKVL